MIVLRKVLCGGTGSITSGPVAQWIRHLTTNQGIAGSSPARIKLFFKLRKNEFLLLLDMKVFIAN